MARKAAESEPGEKKRLEWIAARVRHYVKTRGAEQLAWMVVQLEDANPDRCPPEFEIDEEWPS